ncbi:MAG TPA: CarD family transcriptional regulator, partial [Geminicoccaceae bacterium]
MGERMATLRRLTLPCPPTGRVVLTTADALAQRVPPRAAVRDAAYRIAAGDTLDIGAFRLFLLRAGYVLDERVDEAGEAVVRGGVLDLFPAAAEGPYRLELDGERVTAIRAYDPLTQRGVAEVDELVLEPASEALLPTEALSRRLADAPGGPGEAADRPEEVLLAQFVAGPPDPPGRLPGAEHRLALLYGTPETLFDYAPASASFLLDPEADDRRHAFAEGVREAYEGRSSLRRSEQLAGNAEILLEPDRLYLTEEEWAERLAAVGALTFSRPPSPDDRRLPDLARAGNPGAALRALVRQRLDAGDRVALAATGERERRRLARLATRGSAAPEVAAPEGWAGFLALAPGSLATLPLDLPAGFVAGGSAVVAADDMTGRRRPTAAGPRPTAAAGGALLTADLRLDDYVVHIDHGVGLLRGLETVAEQEDARGGEYLVLEYAGGGRKLVPVLEMDRVWRYGSEEAGVPLDRPEGDAWRTRRERVEAEVAASAEALARLARERAAREAPALKVRPKDYDRFVARFPYAETDDQAQAIEATLADLARGSPPMDRLVCGDVGFGKTEVALRAAAVAATAGRQVAVLAPTTVLVRQHL